MAECVPGLHSRALCNLSVPSLLHDPEHHPPSSLDPSPYRSRVGLGSRFDSPVSPAWGSDHQRPVESCPFASASSLPPVILILGGKSVEGTSAWPAPPVTDGCITLHISASGMGHPEGYVGSCKYEKALSFIHKSTGRGSSVTFFSSSPGSGTFSGASSMTRPRSESLS